MVYPRIGNILNISILNWSFHYYHLPIGLNLAQPSFTFEYFGISECEVTPDFLTYGDDAGDNMYPMNSIPYSLGIVDDIPYNAFGISGSGWTINYQDYWVCNTVVIGYVTNLTLNAWEFIIQVQ